MKGKLYAIALAGFAIGLLGSCQKDNGNDVPQQNDLPAGALPGKFSIGVTKQVCFSQGNLWYGKVGDAQTATFNFERNQYDSTPSSNTSFDSDHISHFFWSKDASVACAPSFSESDYSRNDIFFTNENETTAKADFTVNGVTGKYRTLSQAEWQYLINENDDNTARKGKSRPGVTVCGKANCLVLAPDRFKGTIEASYDSAAWATAEAAGLVCLPAAGGREDSSITVTHIGDEGNYWSSTPHGDILSYVLFIYGNADVGIGFRDFGYSVRLVTDVEIFP